jgi:hypothetical protein
LAWFSNEPEWYDCNVEGFSQEEVQAVSLFAQHLSLDYPSTVIVGDRSNKLFTQEGENPSSINLCSQVNENSCVKVIFYFPQLMLKQCIVGHS